MGMEGDAADLLMKQCIQIAEATLKLSGEGAKNLVAFFYALSQNPQKLKGKTKMRRFVQACNGAARVFPIQPADMKTFAKHARRFGLVWAAVKIEKGSGPVDIVARAEDTSTINRIFERMGYTLPTQEKGAAQSKNVEPRTPQERDSGRRGSGLQNTEHPPSQTSTDKDRPSVRGRLAHYSEEIKRKQPAAPTKGPKLHTR